MKLLALRKAIKTPADRYPKASATLARAAHLAMAATRAGIVATACAIQIALKSVPENGWRGAADLLPTLGVSVNLVKSVLQSRHITGIRRCREIGVGFVPGYLFVWLNLLFVSSA